MLEPNTSGDFSKTFVKIWLLENQKNTVFSHFEKEKNQLAEFSQKKKASNWELQNIFLKK